MSAFLGIDLGSSACKALLVDDSGKLLASASEDCLIHQPGPSEQEQDLEEIWKVMVAAVKSALLHVEARELQAISFSSAMHGMMAVDSQARPLMRMLTWADGRSADEAKKLKQDFDGASLYLRTGCPPASLYYPARILWMKSHRPERFKQTCKFVSIKDAIVHRLCGRWVTDQSHASSNGLLDIHSLNWDQPLLAMLGVGPDQLPELSASDAVVGELSSKAAKTLGLKPGIPIVPGAGDGGLANLGSGAIDPGQVAVTIGSSGASRKILAEPWLDPRARTWCYYLADQRWYAGGAINNGGIVLHWLRDALLSAERDRALAREADPYESIIELADSVPPGAEGLLFLPYLFGERTPYWNPFARGVLFGLAPHHTKAHIARAALEGICMCIAHILELLADSPGGIQEIRASGGFARSASWVQILADMLGKNILLPSVTESSGLGAVILAMKAVGHIKSLSAARELISIEKVFEPDLKRHKLYQERFVMFKQLYEQIEPDFERWSQIQNSPPAEV